MAFFFGKPFIQPTAPRLDAIALGGWPSNPQVRQALMVNPLFFIGFGLAVFLWWMLKNTRWGLIDWKKERQQLEAFMDAMPFRVRLNAQVSELSAGEKQKLEILKLLYLDQRFLIVDEPTSMLPPAEADEVLGLLGDMAHRSEVTVLMISHKFREVKTFCNSFIVLWRGRFAGSGSARTASVADLSQMMIAMRACARPPPAQRPRQRAPRCIWTN